MKNSATVATPKPASVRPIERGRRASGYPVQSGSTISDENFVQPAAATNAPRAGELVSNAKPQTRIAGAIESFVLELEAYCVNGHAAHANAAAAPTRGPPSRRPTKPSPIRASRSKRIDVKCTDGS